MATNTAASFTNHTGNGTAGPFNISFSYLSEAEVDVTVGGVLKTITTHYTFTSATQITFTSGNEPANGVAIKFQRDTNISAKKVDFADGSVLTEADLDANSDQVLFAQQEIIDKLGTIEENATGDQTAAEIRTLVESASDSNVFTDADHSKLNAIEASATADQTAAEIRTLVESASDSNVFTDADHTKLNGIEASATADQTAAEIRTLVESASDSNVFTDADHTKLNGIEAGATADQTITEIKNLIAGSPLDASHLAANSVTTSEIADAELTTLAGMQSGTASKLADSTALTSDIADLNQLDGMAKQTTITDDDTKFPTSGAVVDFVAAQIAPLGGLEVIATDAAFPNTQPSSGVVISISDAGGVAFNGSGTSTTARTVGGSTVTINNAPSSLNNETLVAGVGLMVSSTGSGQIYNYHKILGKEDDIKQLSDDINDFNARYRVVSSNPTSNNDAGDLIFNTSTQKLLVFNSTSNAFEEAQSVGNFFISTLSPAFDGSTQDFTITNAPSNAQQIILSINGVIQKPNSGTSTPSEGFALSGSTVKLAAAPPTGSDYFAIVLGSTVNIGTPSDNTVTTAILQNGSVTNDKVSVSAAIAGTKISPNFGSQNVVTTGTIASSDITIQNSNPGIFLLDTNNNDDFSIRGSSGMFRIRSETDAADRLVVNSDGHVDIGGNLDVAGGLDVTGADLTVSGGVDLTVQGGGAINGTGNLTIDTDTFHVDSANNRVGIGTISPSNLLDVQGSSHSKILIGTTGTSHATGLQISHAIGDGALQQWQLQTDATADGNLLIRNATTGTSTMFFDADNNNVGIGTNSPAAELHVKGSDIVQYVDSSNAAAEICFRNNTSTGDNIRIGGSGNNLTFDTGGSESMRIDSSGNLGINGTPSQMGVANANIGITLQADGRMFSSTSGSFSNFNRNSDGAVIQFSRSTSNVGSISVAANGTTAFNTSSDYRLKENEVAISDGITRLKTLKPYKFNFKVDSSKTYDGFFAHEVSTAVPEAITGTKDEVDSDNNPIYQGIDQSKLVPLLTAALQEAIAKIETLETKVAALEAA